MRNQTYILPEQESFGMNNSLKLLKHYNLKKKIKQTFCKLIGYTSWL